MKLKYDFVTNSSSSSYIFFGVRIDAFTLTKKPTKEGQWKHFMDEALEEDLQDDDNFKDLVADFFDYEFDHSSPLIATFDYESCQVLIGLPPEKMCDDETVARFKERVIEEIDKLGIKDDLDLKISDIQFIHEEIWR